MAVLEHIDTENLYHAYVIEDTEEVFSLLPAFLKGHITDHEMYIREFDTLGVDDSRELIHTANMRSVGTQIFVYKVGSLTREAQNALLKLFEEPPTHTHFFLCVASVGDLIPTLLSRVRVVGAGQGAHKSTLASEFLRAPVGARLTLLEPIIKEKNVQTAEALLRDIEHELYARKTHHTTPLSLAHILLVREVLHDKGASLKALLESTALIIPPHV